MQPLDADALKQMEIQIRTQFRGSAGPASRDDQVEWKLDRPISPGTEAVPHLWLELTESGRKAVEVLLRAVSTALVTPPKRAEE